jgi:hypothetical protein
VTAWHLRLQVRVSIKVKQIDEMDAILANKFSRFLMQRADNFIVLRRKPMPVRSAAHNTPVPTITEVAYLCQLDRRRMDGKRKARGWWGVQERLIHPSAPSPCPCAPVSVVLH